MKSTTVLATVVLALVAVGAAALGLRRGDAPRAYALSDGDDAHLRAILDAEVVYAAKVRVERVGDRGLLLILKGVESKDFPPLPADAFPKELTEAETVRLAWFRGADGTLQCPLPRGKQRKTESVDAEATVVVPKPSRSGEAAAAVLHLTINYGYSYSKQLSGTAGVRKSFRFACNIPTGNVSRMYGALREATAISAEPLQLVRFATAKDGEGVGDLTPGVELLAALAP